MKTKYIIIIGMVILTVIGASCLVKLLKDKDKPEPTPKEEWDYSKVNSFYITYSNGYAMNSYTIYQITYKDGVYKAKIKPYGIREKDTLEIEVEKSVLDKVINVLEKYDVGKWNGYHKTDKNVLDGDSFSISVGLEDNKSISASGYMMWPENYRNVENEISTIFMEIYNNEKGNIENE